MPGYCNHLIIIWNLIQFFFFWLVSLLLQTNPGIQSRLLFSNINDYCTSYIIMSKQDVYMLQFHFSCPMYITCLILTSVAEYYLLHRNQWLLLWQLFLFSLLVNIMLLQKMQTNKKKWVNPRMWLLFCFIWLMCYKNVNHDIKGISLVLSASEV